MRVRQYEGAPNCTPYTTTTVACAIMYGDNEKTRMHKSGNRSNSQLEHG